MNSDNAAPTDPTPLVLAEPLAAVMARKRPAPGERRHQILQALALLLEKPQADRVTTAALAAQLGVSEAALYRHFASKAQMFEALIDFIESALLGLMQQLEAREPDPFLRCQKWVVLLFQFAEKNRGMARVLVGDALVLEHQRLLQRVGLLLDKLEAVLRQQLRAAFDQRQDPSPSYQAQVVAGVLMAFCVGRLQRFARSGFVRLPSEQLGPQLQWLLVCDGPAPR